MKKAIYVFSLTFVALFINAQTTTENYIRTKTYTKDDGTTFIEQIQYFDGFGRLIETIQKEITPSGSDLVSLTEYDSFGRKEKQWLPMVFSGNAGGFINAITITEASPQSYYHYDNKPYSKIEYEAAPTNRITGQYGAGELWYNNNKKARTDYSCNTYDEVPYFFINASGALQRDKTYAEYTLYKTIITDEDGKTIAEFRDKLGQIVMKQNNSNVKTIFVYNDLGQLSYVLPPLAVDGMTTDMTYLDDNSFLVKYGYIYKYDERGNCIEKKLPGCSPVYMVYDKADRLILSQDGNQRSKVIKQWTVTKYDALGRIVYTGLINRSNSRSELANEIKDIVIVEQYDSVNTTFFNTGYTSNYFSGEVTPILINYYDNYNFIKKNSMSLAFYSGITGYTSYYTDTKGLLTGSRVYTLDRNTFLYTATALYYDSKGRIVQSRTKNLNGGFDNIYTSYDFTGNVIDTYKEHSISSFSNFPEQYSYEYDHAGRLVHTNYKYGLLPWIKLSLNTYDELGRLVNTNRHNETDVVNYEYNIRNWLTSIKSGATFEEKLYYNTNPLNTNLCYNGNISFSTWKYNNVYKGYEYEYDELNRLLNANFKQETSNQPNGAFNESFTYDKMGNIETIQRFKDNTKIDDLTLNYNGNQLTHIDDLSGSLNLYNVKEYQNKSMANSGEFTYDENGNLKKDLDRGIVTIRYNLLNLPDTIQFKNGNVIINHYDATGLKFRTDNYTRLTTISPIVEGEVLSPENEYSDINYSYSGTVFIGNMEYNITKQKSPGQGGVGWVYGDTYSPTRMYNIEGYVDNLSTSVSTLLSNGARHNYYRKDHLGNNREVWNGVRKNYSGTVKEAAATRQRTQYYPSGLLWASNTGDNPAIQRNKYNGKEFIEMHGLDTYDYKARDYYPAIGKFGMSIDPLAELYYNISPYVYCLGNPIRYIDNNGMWPTKSVVDNGRVGNRSFSLEPVLNPYHKVMRPHKGQDFPVPEGNRIHALATGVVSNIGYDKKGWGYYVDIQHTGGYTTRYAHLQKGGIKVRIGDKIDTDGEVIALSGMTGGATGPHLHLEVLLNGKPKDPMSIADLQDYLYGSNESINENNPVILKEIDVVVPNPNPQKTLQERIDDFNWSSNRPNSNGNTGRYNLPNRSSDQFYSDDLLKWYYNNSNTK